MLTPAMAQEVWKSPLTPKEALGFSRREELGDAFTHAVPLV